MTPNLIIQALEHFGDGFLFERLCNDIMHLHYPGFNPGGGVHDLGADGLLELEGEETRLYFKTSAATRQTYVFQYSLKEKWGGKVKDTLEKLTRNDIQYDRLVYVTNRNPTTAAEIKLQRYAQETYQKPVEIHNSEFLRVYLEAPENSHLVENYFASYFAQLRRWGVETSIFANVPLAERCKRRALVLLAACVRSSEGQDVREASATEVVLGCIYGEDGRAAPSREEILDELESTFGDRYCLSEMLLDATIDELVRSGRVHKTDESFRLSDAEITRIEAKVAQAYEEDRAFYEPLLKDAVQQRNLTPGQEQAIRMAIAKGIGRVFERGGMEVASAVVSRGQSITLNEYPGINLIAREATSHLDPEHQEIAVQVLRRLFANPTPFEAQYLYGISESYLVYASFSLDPDARILELESIRENILFTDTDIVVQVCVGDKRLQDLYRKMLKATQNLGVTMYTLPQMIDEYIYKIARSHEDYLYMGRPPRLPTALLHDLGDVFVAYFTRIAHTGHSWDQFIATLVGTSRKESAKRRFVQERLEMEYGIQTRDFCAEVSLDKTEIRAFAKSISAERERLQSYKHDDLYETDATVALLLEKLQEKEDARLYRLISSDTVLPRIWQSRLRDVDHVYVFPPLSWFQYVVHHPASRSRPADFALLMKSLTVSPARPKVPRNLLLTLIRFGVNVTNYTTEALEELNRRLYEQWIWRETISRRSSEITDDQAAELGQALGRVLGEIEELVAPDHVELRDRIRQDRRVIKGLIAKKRELEGHLEYYKKKERRRKRYQRQVQRRKPKK